MVQNLRRSPTDRGEINKSYK